MKRKAVILKDLGDLHKGDIVYIVPKHSKILGQTIKSLYNLTTDQYAVVKEKTFSQNINIYIVNVHNFKVVM